MRRPSLFAALSWFVGLVVLGCWASPGVADVRLPRILGSHMVLQRDSTVTIWGWAEPGERIQLACDWRGGHTITIQGNNRIVLEDVLFGEVWLASGQSNMEMPLAPLSGAYTGIKDYRQEIARADYPQIRLFQVGNFSSKQPAEDVQPGESMYGVPPAACQWQPCSPKTVPAFSSTAYFFARELQGYTAELRQAADLPQQPGRKIPTRLYNGMIHPLRKFRIKGVIWYQGESNAGRADKYRRLFSTMIGQWRKAFGYEFPFYYVQLAPFNYRGVNAAYLREAQLETLSVPRTGMVVTMDIGDVRDIHPKNKQEVGRRLALWALAKDYGQDVVYSGPIYREHVVEGNKVRVRFDHVDGGLSTRDGKPPSHFEIAGADKVFYPAQAAIEDDQVVVWSEKVAKPQAVRYAFSSAAEPNLINRAGLPASPFRTDRW